MLVGKAMSNSWALHLHPHGLSGRGVRDLWLMVPLSCPAGSDVSSWDSILTRGWKNLLSWKHKVAGGVLLTLPTTSSGVTSLEALVKVPMTIMGEDGNLN